MIRRSIAALLPLVPKPIVWRIAKRYVAGANLESALPRIRELHRQGLATTISILGESVEDEGHVDVARQEYEDLIARMVAEGLGCNVSVKPTHLGLELGEELCYDNLERLCALCGEHDGFLRIDMEDRTTTDATLRMARRLGERFAGVGTVLQAYLRRTLDDIAALPDGAQIRLCKGIYVEPQQHAFQRYEKIRDSFRACLEALVEHGAIIGVATHDDPLIEHAEKLFAERPVPAERYEFQMLLGVREALRSQLVATGHRVRVYVPYGADWYDYSVRRLRENPQIAVHVLKALFSGGR